MTLASRLEIFRRRGFSEDAAVSLVFMQEALHQLFENFPDTFVLFGGATLVLFYDSSRHSSDIDLLPNSDVIPPLEKIVAAISTPLNAIADALDVSPLTITAQNLGQVERIGISGKNDQLLFTIDISRFSAVIKSELQESSLLGGDVQIKYPSKNLLLLHKAEAFLNRRFVKCRDAFDVKVLLDSGAELDENLKAHLADGPSSEQLQDPAAILKRIEQVTATRCESELRSFIPDEVFRDLQKDDFKVLRESLRELFANWIQT